MKLFIDTGSVAEVEQLAPWGVLSGATTNPTLLAREGANPAATIRRICELLDGPVSAEAVSDDPRELVAQGRGLAALHDHVVVKLPFGPAGLAATRELVQDGIRVNMTLVFSAAQALLSAEAGATYVSCFLGRLDDIADDAAAALAEVIATLRSAESRPRVLAASIRSPRHAVQASMLGADVATIPAAVLRQMTTHPLTDAGIERFTGDWTADPTLAAWLQDIARPVPAALDDRGRVERRAPYRSSSSPAGTKT